MAAACEAESPMECAVTQRTDSELPGLKIRLSQRGLDYAANVAIDDLCSELQGKPIPDHEGTDRVSKGKVEYAIRNTNIQNFGRPTSCVSVTPGSGVTWSATGASIAVRGEWRYKYRWHFVKGSDHGSFDVSASGVDFRVSIKLGVDAEGRPTIQSTGCSCDVSHLKVKFHGGASWLYNIFDGQISRVLKGRLRDMIIDAANRLVNVTAARKLSELNVNSDLGEEMMLDYRLVQEPTFNEGYLDSFHKAEVSSKTNAKPYPLGPTHLPSDTDATKMIYIWGSEFVINSYAHTAFSSGILKHTLSQKDMQEDNYLNPSSRLEGEDRDPPSFVEVDLEATAPPLVSIRPEGISLTFEGNMTLRGHTPFTQLDYVFKVHVKLVLTINVWVEDEQLKSDVLKFEPEFTVLESEMGERQMSNVLLNWIFGNVANKFILPKLRELGKKGFSLPKIKDCKYTEPVIQLNEGNLLIASDVVWDPEKK